jgi:hypothetical protein
MKCEGWWVNKESRKQKHLQLADSRTQSIVPAMAARYLRVMLDPELNGKAYLKHIVDRIEKSVNALAAISGSTWGLPMLKLRQIYRETVLPRMLYACSAWHYPTNSYGFKGKQDREVKAL